MNRFRIILCVLLFAIGAYGGAAIGEQSAVEQQALPANSANQVTAYANPDYVLGPGDQITLVVPGLEDQYSQKVFRIDTSGDVSLPLLGRIHASGLSTGGLEDKLQVKLRPVLKDPQVVVNISSFGSEPVSVLGAVKNPGIVQLQGRKSLFEVLSMAGGLDPQAGYIVQVTRPLKNGNIPLSNVRTDPSTQFGVVSIRLKDIINVPNASENIDILPGDAISIPKAGVVYVVGAVSKPGGYTLDENESLSALQILSLAQGLQSTAAGSSARILRSVPDSPTRVEIPVNLNHLMAGKATDVQLHASDILFVPVSNAKRAGFRTIEAILQAAIYMPVYAGF